MNEISNELNNVFPNMGISNSYQINSVNKSENDFSNGDYSNTSNTNFLSNNTISNQYNYIPDKKHYPANFDMLFDPALINSGQSLIDGNSTSNKSDVNYSFPNESNQPKKDPFEFVNDFLKPKK